MAVGRRERRAERKAAFVEAFGPKQAEVALDLVELLDFAWHDVYGAIAPPPEVIDDLLTCSHGRLDLLVRAAHLGVMDWRDLRVAASHEGGSQPG